MKTATKKFFFILLSTFFIGTSNTQTTTAVTTSPPDNSPSKKLLLFGINDVLLFLDKTKITGSSFASLFGLTPEVVEKELFEVLRSLHVNGLQNYTGMYPEIIEAWLTNQINNQTTQKYAIHHIKRHAGFFKKIRLKLTAEVAFSPYDSAQVLSANAAIIALAQWCKAQGHAIAVCGSWNNDSFEAAKKIHAYAFAPFDAFYLSGCCGILACESRFYDQFLKEYKAENIYLIDSSPENLTAASQKGIKTIHCMNAALLEYELHKEGIL